MSFLKLAMLLIDGDVESNPGPACNIQKSVLGSFHQAHTKFGNSAAGFNVHVMHCMLYVSLQLKGYHCGSPLT